MINNIDNTKKKYVFHNFATKVQIISKNPNFFDKKSGTLSHSRLF